MNKKLDIRKCAVIVTTIAFFVYQMYLALVKQLNPLLQSPLHLVFALFVVYLYNPIDKQYQKKTRKKAEAEGRVATEEEMNKYAALRYIDLLFFAGIFVVLWYSVTQYSRLSAFVLSISPVSTLDNVVMVITLVLLLEAVRRTLGAVLFGFILTFIVYSWVSPYLPGIFFTKGRSFDKMLARFTSGMTMTQSGVYGTPLYTSASCLFYFIVFGCFFSSCGGGQLLIDIGMKFSNKSSGGPAKAAVISSGLMGMVSGSAVANVSTTGVMTIPMMKKIGYAPEEAGAIEAVASTGGQIMPPIMGVGAFIMAEMLGVNYFKVATSAILPAVAYYFGVFVLVSALAKKRASRSTSSEDAKIDISQPILPRLYLLIPVILLVIWIIRGASLMRAGMIGIFSCLACDVVSYFLSHKKPGNALASVMESHGNYQGLKDLWKCCIDGAKQAAEIAIPTAACGIIINVVTMQTSLATNLSNVIASLGTTNLFGALLIAMAGCMILGMALPTVAAYLVGVILFVPVLQKLNIPALPANMFVFYYGIMAQITPPVCVASYTAAGIADGDAMKTGLKGMLFALVGFLAPFVFVYNPAVLLIGTPVEIVIGAAQMLVGTYFLALAVAGYLRTEAPMWMRIVFFVVALGFIDPNMVTTLIALVVGIAMIAINVVMAKKIETA